VLYYPQRYLSAALSSPMWLMGGWTRRAGDSGAE
jgi:hypothetical protein